MLTGSGWPPLLAISSTYALSLRTFSQMTSEYTISPFAVTSVCGAIGKVTGCECQNMLLQYQRKQLPYKGGCPMTSQQLSIKH